MHYTATTHACITQHYLRGSVFRLIPLIHLRRGQIPRALFLRQGRFNSFTLSFALVLGKIRFANIQQPV